MTDDRWWVPFAGAAVYVFLRLVDYLLPSGRHWAFIEKWTRSNNGKKKSETETEEGNPP